MSYRIRGEVTVDVEDYHYNGDIEVACDLEGISELMSENNITTQELVDYQNQHTDDIYRFDVERDDVITHIEHLNFKETEEIIAHCMGHLSYLFAKEANISHEIQQEKEALKAKMMLAEGELLTLKASRTPDIQPSN